MKRDTGIKIELVLVLITMACIVLLSLVLAHGDRIDKYMERDTNSKIENRESNGR